MVTNNNGPVSAKFSNTADIWNKVVVEGLQEEKFVAEEDAETFIVEYGSREDFNNAVFRFNGEIEYTELT
ncbi:MAG: hypothetical protein ACD_84C00045G0003 [uncultured bacterium]|nr:MAG: hypothetical protein ACD_84C00045G0003 [uncultured bacterium]